MKTGSFAEYGIAIVFAILVLAMYVTLFSRCDTDSGSRETVQRREPLDKVRESKLISDVAWKLITKQEAGRQDDAVAKVLGSKTPYRRLSNPENFIVVEISTGIYEVTGEYWQSESNSFDPRYHSPVDGGSPRKIKHRFTAKVMAIDTKDWQLHDFSTRMIVDNFGRTYDN